MPTSATKHQRKRNDSEEKENRRNVGLPNTPLLEWTMERCSSAASFDMGIFVNDIAQEIDTRLKGIFSGPNTKKLSMQTRAICIDYIYQKLSSRGLLSSKTELNPPYRKSDVSTDVIALGRELEKRHPAVYSDISRKLNITMSSETIVKETLTSVLEKLFFDTGDVTWARIVSLFAVAGQFAIECVAQGHPEFVRVVVDAVCDFTDTHLMTWLTKSGGWIALTEICHPIKSSHTVLICAMVGFILGVAGTITVVMKL